MWWTTVALARDCTPTVFAPGVLSLPERSEFRAAFSPDGRTVWFHVDVPRDPDPPAQTIWTARQVRGRWTPAVVAPFSGAWRDSDPFVGPDGAIRFSSNRPVSPGEPARPDTDLWVVEPLGDGWGAPVHLDGVNTDHDELYPSVTAEGTLYWATDADGGLGGWDLYRAAPIPGTSPARYQPPENLGPPLNTERWEFNPWVSPDGRRLLFVGLRHPDGLGIGDLYTSVAVDGGWGAPRNLGPAVNSAGDDFHPTLGPRHQLVFVRKVWEPDTPSDLFVVDARCAGL
ncbi:MAG: hypothetical protein ABMB14_14410 [Myxococcota bacterium]